MKMSETWDNQNFIACQMNCLIVFFNHLKLELLKQFSATNAENISIYGK